MDSKRDNDNSQEQTQAINGKYKRKGKIQNVMLCYVWMLNIEYWMTFQEKQFNNK